MKEEKGKREYGENNVVLMQVGAFYKKGKRKDDYDDSTLHTPYNSAPL